MGVWTARNDGLTGGALAVHWVVQNPATRHLDSTQHELWIATDGGVLRSFNGGRQWRKIVLPQPSNDEFSTALVSVDDINFYWIDYSPVDRLTLFVLAWHRASEQLWIYKTTDLGESWTSRGIVPAV